MSKKSSLSHRMDVRTREEFADDIKTYTGIEGFVMMKWLEEMNVTTDNHFYAESTGVDNDGEVIDDFVGINHDYDIYMAEPPYGDETVSHVDIKHNYNNATATFKAHNLEAYIKHGVSMLVILGTGLNGRELRPTSYEDAWKQSFGRRQWALVHPAQIKNITDNVPCTKIRFMGNRPGFMIYKRQFGTYFDLREFEKV